MRQRITLEPNVKTQNSLKTKLLKYGGGGLVLMSIIGIGFWLYFQMGQTDRSMAATGNNPPSNDTKAEATWLTNLYEAQSANKAYTNSHATSDAQSGSCFTNGAQNGVWFKFKALYNEATITIETGSNKGTISNLEVALLDNSNNEITCSSSSASGNVTLNPTTLTQDNWYYLLVDSKTSSDTGSFTVYINNVSPVKYYTRDQGDWDDNSTWSTSGYNGPSAGSLPSKENVVFIKDLNGDLKLDGIAAECAGIELTSTNKKSVIKTEGNATLNVYGRVYYNGMGNKEMNFESDEATVYVQDEFFIEKKGGSDEAKVKIKKTNLTIERSFLIEHIGGKGLEIEIEDNNNFSVGEDFVISRQGGYDGMEIKIEETDLTIGGTAQINFNGGSGGLDYEYKKNSTFTAGKNIAFYRNGGSGDMDVKVEDNVTMDATGDFIFNFNNGSSKVIFEMKDNCSITAGGDFIMNKNGGNNKFEVLFEDLVNVTASGDASFSMKGGSSGFELDFKKNVHFNIGGNISADKTGGTNPLQIDLEDNASLEAGGFFSGNHTNGSNGVEITVGKNNKPAHIKAGGDFTFGSPSWSATKIEIEDGSYLEVKGDLYAAGTRGKLDFKGNGSVLKLTGDTTQQITGETNNSGLEIEYKNIEVNNAYNPPSGQFSVVITDNGFTLEEELNLIDGIVQTTISTLIILDKNAEFKGGSTDSYVSGPLQKIGTDDVVFPVGKNDRYAPVGLIDFQNNNPSTEFRVEYFDEAYPDTATGPGLTHVSKVEYWDIQKINGNPAQKVKVELHWIDGSQSGITDPSDLVIAHYDGNEWESTAPNTVSGMASAGNIITNNKQSNFSPYTFGSSSGGNVLPIDLTTFDVALQSDNTALLTWETSKEINNDFFTVERSTDGSHFEEIGTVQGAGNSDEPLQYELIDEAPQPGVNYYRLKQTDYDGQFEYFPVEQVEVTEQAQSNAASVEISQVYPVPFSDQFTVQVNASRAVEANIALVNMSGSQVPISTHALSEGRNTIQSPNLSHLPKGTYVLTIMTPNEQITKKITKAR